ncbi:MAG: GIY-YIG nuclease family protein [Pseudomonadota bacterium]
MHYTYVLRSKKDGKRYIGSTSDLKERVKKHNAGSVKSTKHRRPFELEYFETFESKREAESREKFFKSKIGYFRLNENILRGRAAR